MKCKYRSSLVSILLVTSIILNCMLSAVVLTYHTTTKTVHYTVWIDWNAQVVISRTVVTYNKYIWRMHIETWSKEQFRSNAASTSIQWAIDNTSEPIHFSPGQYILNETIYIDSNTKLKGIHGHMIILTGSPPIFDATNASYVTISNLNCTIQED